MDILEQYIYDQMKNVIESIEDQTTKSLQLCSAKDDTRNMKIGSNIKTLKRNIISYTLPLSYKFMDKIEWDENRTKCIVIGYNPSLSVYENIDRTNKKMIVALDEVLDMGGYFLLNYYPIVDSDPESVIEDITSNGFKINQVYTLALKNILEFNLKNDKIPVILMWGPTLAPEATTKDIYRLLEKYKESELLRYTCKKNDQYKFIHGSGRRIAAKDYHFPKVDTLKIDEFDNTIVIEPPLITIK